MNKRAGAVLNRSQYSKILIQLAIQGEKSMMSPASFVNFYLMTFYQVAIHTHTHTHTHTHLLCKIYILKYI